MRGPVPPLPVDRDGLVQRARLTAEAAALAALGLPALVLAVLGVVSVALVPVLGIGVVALAPVWTAAVALAGLQRRLVTAWLGRDVHDSPIDPDARGVLTRVRRWASDPSRVSDLVHAAWAGTGGLLLSGLMVVLAAAPVAHVVLALTLGSVAERLLFVLIAPMATVAWWVLTPYLSQVRLTADALVLGGGRTAVLERRVDEVTRSRAASVDHSAAELRRIERDLHDGPQARLASLGISLGLAEQLVRDRPDEAVRLLTDARGATASALDDLRSLVRQIHPPVLADRGLAGGIEALVLDVAVPVTSSVELPAPARGAPPAPVEAAAYFAVAECLANVVKHSGARRAWVRVAYEQQAGTLRLVVGDDGRGGASLASGSGLAGVARRLAAFDGTMDLTSPVGGPTTVEMEIPCALSSPRTTPSSGTD